MKLFVFDYINKFLSGCRPVYCGGRPNGRSPYWPNCKSPQLAS